MSYFDFQQNKLLHIWLYASKKALLGLTNFLFVASDDTDIKPVFTCLGS